jgi:glutamine amidotransferase PdxT
MISAILTFFGITLLYTGFLASADHAKTAIAATCAGLVLLAKPALGAVRLLRTHLGARMSSRRRTAHGKKAPQKVYLKIVKSEDERPTIH